VIGTAFVCLYQHQEFPEDLAKVATIDFVNDENERAVRVIFGTLAELKEDSVLQAEGPAFKWTVPTDEILVGVRLMKLNKLDASGIAFLH